MHMASIRKMRTKWYARIVWRLNGKLKEILIPLKTTSLTTARTRLKSVNNEESDIISGIIQKFQFKGIFRWLNGDGTSRFTSLKLGDIIPEYLKHRRIKQREGCVERDYYSLKQLTEVLGDNKAVQDITYKDMEEKFIPYFQNKGYSNGGINISARTVKVFLNYLHKEKLISEKITFSMLPVDQEPCFINRAEIKALHDAVDARWRRWFTFYELTGCRASDPFKGFLEGNQQQNNDNQQGRRYPH